MQHYDINKIINHIVSQKPGQTYQQLSYFVDKFGPRMTGTQNLEDSIDFMLKWLQKELLSDGQRQQHMCYGNYLILFDIYIHVYMYIYVCRRQAYLPICLSLSPFSIPSHARHSSTSVRSKDTPHKKAWSCIEGPATLLWSSSPSSSHRAKPVWPFGKPRNQSYCKILYSSPNQSKSWQVVKIPISDVSLACN